MANRITKELVMNASLNVIAKHRLEGGCIFHTVAQCCERSGNLNISIQIFLLLDLITAAQTVSRG
jgi:hypothetical protein